MTYNDEVRDYVNKVPCLQVLNLWEQLSPAMRRVGELVGIDERFMARAMRGTLSLSTSKQVNVFC